MQRFSIFGTIEQRKRYRGSIMVVNASRSTSSLFSTSSGKFLLFGVLISVSWRRYAIFPNSTRNKSVGIMRAKERSSRLFERAQKYIDPITPKARNNQKASDRINENKNSIAAPNHMKRAGFAGQRSQRHAQCLPRGSKSYEPRCLGFTRPRASEAPCRKLRGTSATRSAEMAARAYAVHPPISPSCSKA